MEDDRHILAVLSCQDRVRRREGGGGGEVVLNPNSLTGKKNMSVSLSLLPVSLSLACLCL